MHARDDRRSRTGGERAQDAEETVRAWHAGSTYNRGRPMHQRIPAWARIGRSASWLTCIGIIVGGFAGMTATRAVAQTAVPAQHAADASSVAGDTSAGSETSDNDRRPSGPLRPDPAFAHYPVYRGTIGGKPVVLRIGVKPDDPEGLNGEYQYLPNGPVILIAGARDGKTLTLEESDDGTEISGQWVGFYADDGSLSGERMNDDTSDSIGFEFRPAPR